MDPYISSGTKQTDALLDMCERPMLSASILPDFGRPAGITTDNSGSPGVVSAQRAGRAGQRRGECHHSATLIRMSA